MVVPASGQILPGRNPGAFIKKRLGVFFEQSPEWKHSTLLGPAFIDGASTGDEVKKTAEMLAVNAALPQGKPALNLSYILPGKRGRIHFSCASHFLQLFKTDPDITSPAPAAFSSTGFAGIAIKMEGEIALRVQCFLIAAAVGLPPFLLD
jgi:hypothetical protein